MIEITGWSALLSGGEEEGEVGLWKREVPKVAWCLLLLGWLVFNNLRRILKVFFYCVLCVHMWCVWECVWRRQLSEVGPPSYSGL